MPADIVIHDNRVEVIDGPLVLRDGGEQGVISATRISSIPEVSTRELRAENCQVQAIEVGTGSPQEPRSAGSGEAKDRQGWVTLKIDGRDGTDTLVPSGSRTKSLGHSAPDECAGSERPSPRAHRVVPSPQTRDRPRH